MSGRSCHVLDLGLLGYAEAYRFQKSLVEEKRAGVLGEDFLLLVEHPAVYTSGRKSGDLPLPANSFVVERGGRVTYHNEGQLVCYPILSLEEGERDLHAYLRRLEAVVIAALADFGVGAGRKEGATGVWVHGGTRKIASLGVAVSGWVTYHGCAINVSNDLSGFHAVQPCGFEASIMTSLRELLGGNCPTLDSVKERFVTHFRRELHRPEPSPGFDYGFDPNFVRLKRHHGEETRKSGSR